MKKAICTCDVIRGVLVHDLDCPLVIREMSNATASDAADSMLNNIRHRNQLKKSFGLVMFWTVVIWLCLALYWIGINGGIAYVRHLWHH